MNPKYYISLDLAKRLKELSCPQESEFYWERPKCLEREEDAIGISGFRQYYLTYRGTNGFEKISAFTVGELGEMLPQGYVSGKIKNGYGVAPTMADGYKQYNARGILNKDIIPADNEAEARGLMLEYLYKEGLIKGGGE